MNKTNYSRRLPISSRCHRTDRQSRATIQPARAAYTLVEMLIVVAIIGIVAGAAIPLLGPNISSQLSAGVSTVEGDIYYAQQLAITHASTYRVTFSTTDQTYTLTHTGSDTSLNTLPTSPFDDDPATATRHVHNIADLLPMNFGLELVAMHTTGTPQTNVAYVEFGPDGAPTSVNPIRVWFKAGTSSATRYLYFDIQPITGLTKTGDIQASAPAALSL